MGVPAKSHGNFALREQISIACSRMDDPVSSHWPTPALR